MRGALPLHRMAAEAVGTAGTAAPSRPGTALSLTLSAASHWRKALHARLGLAGAVPCTSGRRIPGSRSISLLPVISGMCPALPLLLLRIPAPEGVQSSVNSRYSFQN